MSWEVLAVGGGLIAFFAIGLLFLRQEARKLGAAKANADTAKRQVEALKQQETRKDETLGRMADAAAASVGEPADRIRERMRKRPATTK